MSDATPAKVGVATIVREWGRIGVTGFGGPPAHIALLRKLCVEQRGWISHNEFDDALAAASLLPGPTSTQLAIFCAWRLRGWLGALIGGVCFIAPGLIIILALSAVFLAAHTPLWVKGAAEGAGAVVPVVALSAASLLVLPSWRRASGRAFGQTRWLGYFVVGAVVAATLGSLLVVVLLACGALEVIVRASTRRERGPAMAFTPAAAAPAALGGLAALCWVAIKVGALSFGGGFVIVPLMQHDAVTTYHWMTGTQFLSAVALGQVTPGPVVQTVAVVGYAAAGLAGGLLAALIAFTPSFVFVMAGAPRFDRLRANRRVQDFLVGSGAAVIGAIAGSSVPLARELLHVWQLGLLAAGVLWLLALRRGVVSALVGAGVVGVILVLVGAPH